MYPEDRILNMMEGYKEALIKGLDRRAAEIKRFLSIRGVTINSDNTWSRNAQQ